MEHQHTTSPSTAITKDTVIYEEVERWRVDGALQHLSKLDGRTTVCKYIFEKISYPYMLTTWTDVVQDGAAKLKENKPDPRYTNPKMGVGLVKWSPDAHYFCTKNGKSNYFRYIEIY